MKDAAIRSAYELIEPLTAVRSPMLPRFIALQEIEPLQIFERYPFALAAIRLSSPDLVEALSKQMTQEQALDHRVRSRLNLYIRRMCTRPTPFGMFASIGAVSWADQATTTLELAPAEKSYTATRPDMAWLFDLARSLETDLEVRSNIKLYANDMAILRADRIFVHNPRSLGQINGRPVHNPTSLRANEAVRWVRERAQGIAYGDLAREVSERYCAGDAFRANKFIEGLWEAGVLVSDLIPPSCGSPLRYFQERITEVKPNLAARLRALAETIRSHDAQPVSLQTMDSIAKLEAAITEVAPGKRVLATDTVRPTIGALPRFLRKDLERYMPLLLCFQAHHDPLAALRLEFMRRYEGLESLVPLLELADPEFGIEIPALEPMPDAKGINPKLLEIFARSCRDRKDAVLLTDEEAGQILHSPDERRLPDSFEVAIHIIATDESALNRREYLICPSRLLGSGGAGRSLGRFADLLGDGVSEAIRDQEKRAGHQDLVAELAVVPSNGRAANVAQRPDLFGVELQLGLYGNRPGVTRISPADILVGLHNDSFFLWSKSRAKRLRLHESHLMNVAAFTTPAARFLSAMQQQQAKPTRFNWGPLAECCSLPRLQYDRLIVSLAKFRLPRKALTPARLPEWRARWSVPRYVVAGAGDRTIFVDLESDDSAELLAESTPSASQTIELEECPYITDSNWIQSAGNVYVGEFVASLRLRRPRPDAAAEVSSLVSHPRVASTTWLSAKLYAGPERIDRLLREHVPNFIARQETLNSAVELFFVRYADPNPHLRVRLLAHDESRNTLRERLLLFMEQLCGLGLIDDFALCPYFPELQRYGGPLAMKHVEKLFCIDSAIVLDRFRSHMSTPHDRMEGAFETLCPLFDAFVSAGDVRGWLATDTSIPRLKLEPDERALARPAANHRLQPKFVTELANAAEAVAQSLGLLSCKIPNAMLRAILHMHCNRFGLSREQEQRALVMLRQRAVSLSAQHLATILVTS